jgi:hypothetical protein
MKIIRYTTGGALMAMEPNRQHWNEEHKALHAALAKGSYDQAMEIFLPHHAAVHSARLTAEPHWSMEDEVWEGLSEEAVRLMPKADTRSVAWLTWHIARIEDMTMNVLALGGEQVFWREDWGVKLGIERTDAGNQSDDEAVKDLSKRIDLAAVRAYRLAVGRATREQIPLLSASALKEKVSPARLQRILDEGALYEHSMEILNYWRGLTVAGLLLMPATRHNFVHLNEASRMKK